MQRRGVVGDIVVASAVPQEGESRLSGDRDRG